MKFLITLIYLLSFSFIYAQPVELLNGSRANDIIAFGLEEVFGSLATTDVSIAKLDDSHVVIAYQAGSPPYGEAVVGTISGNTISFGSPYDFNAGGTDNISVTALDENNFVVAYQDDGASGFGYARVGSVSGSTITYDGSETIFHQKGAADEISVAALDASTIVIAFQESGCIGFCVVGTVSGSTLSFGGSIDFHSIATSLCSVTALDATHFIVAYNDNYAPSYGVAKPGEVSGYGIDFGSAVTFGNRSTTISTSKIDATKFIVAYHHDAAQPYGSAKIGEISGIGINTLITFGSANNFYTGTPQNVSVTMLDETHLAVGYEYGSNGYSKMGSVTGTTISYGSEYQYNTGTVNFSSAIALDECNFVIAYQDGGGSNYGTAIVGQTNALIYDGSSGTDWDTDANWNSGSVPTSADNVIIPDVSKADAPVIGTNVNANCNNLTIESGGSLTIQSDASATGSLIVYGTAKGDVNVERYIPAWGDASHGWHFLASPVASQAISTEFVDVTATPISPNVDFYRWSETEGLWINIKAENGNYNRGDGETYFSNDVNPTFTTGIGYLVAYSSNQDKTFSGALNNSDVNFFNLSCTDGSTHTGWHLLGNPYSSNLKWNTTDWNLSGCDATAKIWKETTAAYIDIFAGSTDIIPAMQGFMVCVSGSSNTLRIDASDRTHNSQNWYKETEINKIKLIAYDPQGSTAQESIIKFNEKATSGYDSEYDSRFLSGYAPMLYSRAEGSNVSTNTLPELKEELSIPLYFTKNSSTSFYIEAEGLDNLAPSYPVYLTDLKTNYTQNLTENPLYSFTSEEGDDPARFLLHFKAVGIEQQAPTSSNIQTWSANKTIHIFNPENQKGEVFIYNLFGQQVVQARLNGDTRQEIHLSVPTGYYLVSIVYEKSIVNRKVFME